MANNTRATTNMPMGEKHFWTPGRSKPGLCIPETDKIKARKKAKKRMQKLSRKKNR